MLLRVLLVGIILSTMKYSGGPWYHGNLSEWWYILELSLSKVDIGTKINGFKWIPSLAAVTKETIFLYTLLLSEWKLWKLTATITVVIS